MTIGKKLTASFVAMLFVTLVLGIASLGAINKLSASLDVAVNDMTKKIDLIQKIDSARLEMVAAQRGIVVYSYGKSPEGAAKASQAFQAAARKWADSVARIRPLLVTAEGERLVNDLDAGLVSWRSAFTELEGFTAAGDPEAAMRVGVEKCLPISQSAAQNSQRLQEIQKGILENDREAARDTKSLAYWITFIMIVVAIIAAAAILLIVRQTTRTLQQAASDLTEGAEQVASASQQVALSSRGMAEGASEQAASLEETSASTEELNATARQNSDSTRTATELVQQSGDKFGTAERTLAETIAAMESLAASGQNISKIIKVIDEIAFQTNILALNAAVEAARAGESGAGFAVVADEVRSLAQRSAQAARDTTALIEESINRSQIGKAKVDEVAAAVRSIGEETQRVDSLVREVNVASQEQAHGLEQVAKAITQMEQVTQRNAASAEEGASAAEQLAAQSKTVKGIAQRLNALVHSKSRAAAGPRRPVPIAAKAQPRQFAPVKPAPALRAAARSRKDDFPMETAFREA